MLNRNLTRYVCILCFLNDEKKKISFIFFFLNILFHTKFKLEKKTPHREI